ncbi:hypothetical protein Btru_056145 [Bulinus truncatus]|nr:hypothetical protein Btru_056145 [Bulinus truncatus]
MMNSNQLNKPYKNRNQTRSYFIILVYCTYLNRYHADRKKMILSLKMSGAMVFVILCVALTSAGMLVADKREEDITKRNLPGLDLLGGLGAFQTISGLPIVGGLSKAAVGSTGSLLGTASKLPAVLSGLDLIQG